MRIALLHYSAPPVTGGVEIVLAQQAEVLHRAGHVVEVFAGRGASWHPDIPVRLVALLDSRHPEVLEIKRNLDQGTLPPQFEALVERLITELRAQLSRFEVVFLHNVCALHKNLALTAALHQLQRQLHFVLWQHDLAWTSERYLSELHQGYPWDLLRTIWEKARYVTISEARRLELATLLHLPSEKITVVANGINLSSLLKLEAQTQTLIQALQLLEASPLILLPARLTPRKNIELALKVLVVLRQTFPHGRLVITGPEGPHNPANAAYKKKLLTLRDELGLKDCAHFLIEYTSDFLPTTIVADLFRLADALFLPSWDEGFGIPILEAGLMRLPIFSSALPSLRELCEHEAVLFAPADPPEKIAALVVQKLQTDESFRLSTRVKQRFTWDQIYKTQLAPLLSSIKES